MHRIVGPLLLQFLVCCGLALAADPAKSEAPAKDSGAARQVFKSKMKKKSPEIPETNQIELEQVGEDWKSTPNKSVSVPNSSVKIKEIVESSSEYSYASTGSMDPFLQPDLGFDSGLNKGKASGEKIRMVSVLQGYPLSDLAVKGLWQLASGENRAIILTPRNEGVVIKEGDPISSGKVLSIKRDEVLVRLYRLRSDGVREFEDVPLKINSNAKSEEGVIVLEPGKDPVFNNSGNDKSNAQPPNPARGGLIAPAVSGGTQPNAIRGVSPIGAPELDRNMKPRIIDGAPPQPK